MVNSRRRFLGKGLTCVTGIMAGSYWHANASKWYENGHRADKPEPLPAINSGVGGNNTADLLNRIEKDCLAHRPKLTILMAGTNDMNSVKYVPAAAYEKNLSAIAGRIMAAGSQLLLMTILPMYEPYLLTRHPAAFYKPEGIAGRREQVNAIIKKTARDHKAVFLDMGQRFMAVGNVGTGAASLIQNEVNAGKTDGIHPTPNGYRFIALSVFDCIVYNGLPRDQIVCFGDSITRGDGSSDHNSYPGFLNKLLTTA